MNRILVTGASGTVGRQVVSQLLATGAPVRALTRNPDTARLPPGVEVVRADLTAPATLDACLEGIDAVFLVWTAPADAAPAAVSKIASHAGRVVLLTSPHQTRHPLFQQPNPIAALHAEIERLIDASGLRWTFRLGMFAANARHWWAGQIRAGDVVRWPYAAAPTAPIHERDIAAVAVRALREPGHDGAQYVLTGPQSLTQREQVATIADVIGQPLRFEEMSPQAARQEWRAPAPVVEMLLKAWEAAVGQPALVTDTVAQITAAPARTFRDWVTDHVAEFPRLIALVSDYYIRSGNYSTSIDLTGAPGDFFAKDPPRTTQRVGSENDLLRLKVLLAGRRYDQVVLVSIHPWFTDENLITQNFLPSAPVPIGPVAAPGITDHRWGAAR